MAKANTPTTTPKPWERQPRETPKAFAAFTEYRDMTPSERSCAKVAEAVGKSKSLIEQWCTKYGWVERVAEWDNEQDRIEREIAQKEQVKAIKRMRERHIEIACQMLDKAAEKLKELDTEEIRPADIPRIVDSATKLERISRGDVETVIEERHGETATPAVQFYLPSNNRENIGEDDDE